MIEQINHIAGLWWSGATAMFWQVGVLIILIGCVDLLIRRWAWPQLRYALWLMVLVKLILPPTIYLSTSITSGLQPLAKQIIAKESRRENLNITTAMIIANLKAATAEPTVEDVSSYDTVTEYQPGVVFTGSGNVAGKSLNTGHVKPVWQVYAMAVWLVGMFILGGWLVIKLLHLRKEDRRLATTALLPESFYDAIARCAKSLELRQVPKVVLTRKVACPAVFGMVRPVLLMPVGYLTRMTRSDTEHMLLHELAHIKRGDLWVHGFYMFLQIVYWYNPLLWLVRSQMHHLRELCCDTTVARLLKERIIEYRQTLIDVARRFLTKPTEPGLGLLGLFEDSNRLLVRLNWLKKETWRYQKMKKLTVITTIVLMIAFVLPMAQAQDKPSTENSSADPVQAVEQPSQSEEISVIEQDENEPQTKEQLLQAMQDLQNQFQQLQIERQKLQQQIQALTQARLAKDKAEEVGLKAKEAKDKAMKASKEAEKATKDQAAKAKASIEARKAGVIAKQQEQWAKAMEVWSQQWANSDEFKNWQKDMEQWAKEQANAHEQAESSDNVSTSAPEAHPMPAMPPMPPMPTPAEVVAPAIAAPAPPVAPVAVEPVSPAAPTVVVPKVEPHSTSAAVVAPSTGIAGPALVLPTPPGPKSESTRNIEIEKDKDGKYVATTEMHFVSKVQSGSPFVVRNSLGNIILKPGKDDTCDVRAVIRGKDKTEAKARTMVEQVSMNLHSSDERYYLRPVKQDGDQWSNLSVDFYITVPPGVLPDVKTDLGNIEISNLQGKIKAATELGSIKAVNATGEIELFANMGDIEFVAPKNLSAKLQAQTKMGEIESELPLEIDRSDMFKRTAEGTTGTGRANIKMATEMGSISLKWQPPAQDGLKL